MFRFKRSARKHGISRTSALHVINTAEVGAIIDRSPRTEMEMFFGPDHTGELIEVGTVTEDGVVTVMHAMKLRNKYREIYEQQRRQ